MAVDSDNPVNFRVTQGETFSLQLEYQDPTENPINISDYTIVFTAKNKPQGKTTCATCTIGDGVDMSRANQGIINLTVSSSKTSLFVYPRTHYQIKARDPYSSDFVFLQGWFEVTAG